MIASTSDSLLFPKITHYRWLETDDGSYTLEFFCKENNGCETMHSKAGAFSETLYVYGSAVRLAIQLGLDLRVLSVGAGIGMSETAAVVAAGDQSIRHMASFEANQDLRQLLILSLQSRESARWTPWYFAEQLRMGCAELILKKSDSRISQNKICKWEISETWTMPSGLGSQLNRLYTNGTWQINGSWDKDVSLNFAPSLIFYDPFSRRTNPNSWNEELLSHTLSQAAENGCVFASFSAQSQLRRMLTSYGFEAPKRRGFGGKRECTLAVRSSRYEL